MNRADFQGQLGDEQTAHNAKLLIDGVIQSAGVQLGLVERPNGQITVLMADLHPDHQEIGFRSEVPAIAIEKGDEGHLRVPLGVVQGFTRLGQAAMQELGAPSAAVPHPRHSVSEGPDRTALFDRWKDASNPYSQLVVLDWEEGGQPSILVNDKTIAITQDTDSMRG